jgi:hypothetical protein
MVLTSAVDRSFDQSTKLMRDYISEPSRELAFLRSEVSKFTKPRVNRREHLFGLGFALPFNFNLAEAKRRA